MVGPATPTMALSCYMEVLRSENAATHQLDP